MRMKVSSDPGPVKMKVPGMSRVRTRIGTAIEMVDGTPYTGDYEVTPSGQTQVLATDGLLMQGNITINPIPSNYGLVTWDGSALTVS